MTQHQIEKGFWCYQPTNDFPPKGISLLEDYDGNETLNLYLENSSHVKAWSKFLPTLENVKFLWISSNVNQELFESICNMKNLIGLNIEKNSIKNIDAIGNVSTLTFLRLANFTTIENIKSLSLLISLEVLELENFKNVSDFQIIGKLKKLQGLSISGSMFSSQRIENIDFIKSLTSLKYLMLINSKMTDKNFDALLNLHQLETFYSSYNYPRTEFEKLKSLPNLKTTNLPLFQT
ncbi:hypothetical protein HYN48_13580 [Flavobacterium magnum]|uniref:Leucine-rich repeat domain-containing protein n=1 Tax=Flavobacterium magnum TaxID=2162713 RepID=A0A2S0RHL7_9FLAO|nr:leucine-rich repeat domain-containing protein [Flavobacterium magnum]AWA31029.1 hypothetical protein HYN48_13580 [Flavobacterium magnum]